jgi:hypothetical protein
MARYREAAQGIDEEQRRPLPDWEAAQIALERYRPLQDGEAKVRSNEDLAAQFNRDPAVISRAVKRAIREQLIDFRVTIRHGPPPKVVRVFSLEDELLGSWPKAHPAMAIGSTRFLGALWRI